MIVRVLLLALLSFLVVRALRMMLRGVITGVIGTGPQAGPQVRSQARSQAPVTKLVRDPVCGTHVAPRSALSLVSGGTTHYFCSQECRDKYRSTL